MSIEQAMADLAAATSTEHLGRAMEIEGVPDVPAVKVSMTAEEALSFSGGAYSRNGLGVEGCRVTVAAAYLSAMPVVGGVFHVSGQRWDVRKVGVRCSNVRITLTRFIG